jgi:ribulose-phosphate 3-epimerase
MIQIIPGILEKDWHEIERKLEIIKPFSRKVHIDFLDGKFSQEMSFLDPTPFSKYKDDFFMEAHLMVEDPAKYIKPLSEVGFNRFLGHVEKIGDINEFIAEGQIHGEVGLAVDIDTAIESLQVPYDDLDCVLLMSIKAGKSGQIFLPQVLEKIQKLKQRTVIPIEIDGGIDQDTIVSAKKEGVSRFVTTSFIFQNQDPMQAFEKLLNLVSD